MVAPLILLIQFLVKAVPALPTGAVLLTVTTTVEEAVQPLAVFLAVSV